jgi:hypothetical protein
MESQCETLKVLKKIMIKVMWLSKTVKVIKFLPLSNTYFNMLQN